MFLMVSLQADEGPVEEGGVSEAQGAGGEEQECSTRGGGQEEGGQHVRELPAGEGEACVRFTLMNLVLEQKFSSQQPITWPLPAPVVKDSLRQKTERIEELEEALRESVQITAEREMVLAQEEAARSLQEKQVHNSP